MAQELHRATARVLDILECLSNASEGMTLTELAQALGAPKSSLFPIVHTLQQRQYLQQFPGTSRYTIGPSSLVLGSAYTFNSGIVAITDVIKQVVAASQETCQFGILDQGNVLYIAKEDSPEAIRMISRVGNRLPANATAIGKALLSGLTNAEVRALYANGLPRLTARTITDIGTLLNQLDDIRNGGIACEQEESTPQLACWALPLCRGGKVFAALSVSVPLFRCQPGKIELICQSLRRAKVTIEQLAELQSFGI